MLVFSFMSATPMGKAPIVFTLKHYRAFIDQPYLLEHRLDFAADRLLDDAALRGASASSRRWRWRAPRVGRMRETLLILILLPFWTNGLVRVFSWTMVLREDGFLDYVLHMFLPDAGSIGFLYTRYAIVLGLVHGYLPYMILTCYIALVTIDDAIIEAAASLGARVVDDPVQDPPADGGSRPDLRRRADLRAGYRLLHGTAHPRRHESASPWAR